MDAFPHPQHCARRGGACLEDLHSCKYPSGRRFRQKEIRFLGYVVSSQVVLTFRCSPDFYRGFIQGFSKIAAPLTSMLRTSSSTDSSTSMTQIVVEYDGVDDGGGRSGDFDVTFQVTRRRSGHCSSARTVAFNCASEADHEKPIPVALD